MIDQAIEMYTRAMTTGASAYLAVLAGTAIFAVAWRVATTPRRRAAAEPVSATELAFLRSDIAAVVTALAGLRAGGRITRDRRVDRAVRSGPEIDPFTDQVLEQVASAPNHTVSGVFDAARGDLLVLERALSERGLVRTRAERARMRWGTAPLVLVLLFGVGFCVYLGIGLFDRPDVGVPFTVVCVATTLFATVGLPQLLTVNRLTRAGRRLLEAEQERLSYLRPAERPAFATYGPAAVALSVALFGTGALWAIDADYSTSVELAGDSSGGTDDAGCGASCGGDGGGGGGCGGGCGGCGGCGG
jgi:uncharacterized protein (TIGR04222 family)